MKKNTLYFLLKVVILTALIVVLDRIAIQQYPDFSRWYVRATEKSVAAKIKMGKTDVNKLYCRNQTRLHLACEQDSVVISRALIEKGADVNAKDHSDRMPLHNVLNNMPKNKENYLALTKLLIENGAKTNTPNYFRDYPLHLAIGVRQPEIVNYLLDYGASIDQRDDDDPSGRTPLHIAAEHGLYEIVSILLDRGADPKATTFYYGSDQMTLTPLQVAQRRSKSMLDYSRQVHDIIEIDRTETEFRNDFTNTINILNIKK